ncbi:NAD-dependent DNA ligase [Gracilaria domingensis]|nr:NAD-dependent DNA ligase [Gracilaria domingensis]
MTSDCHVRIRTCAGRLFSTKGQVLRSGRPQRRKETVRSIADVTKNWNLTKFCEKHDASLVLAVRRLDALNEIKDVIFSLRLYVDNCLHALPDLTRNHGEESAEKEDHFTAVLHQVRVSLCETSPSSQSGGLVKCRPVKPVPYKVRRNHLTFELKEEDHSCIWRLTASFTSLSYGSRNWKGIRIRAPREAVAYKFVGQSRVTRLNDVVMQVSREVHKTTVAILELVRTAGGLMSRATRQYFDEMKRLGVAVWDVVRIERGCEFILKELETEERLDDPGRTETIGRSRCPS